MAEVHPDDCPVLLVGHPVHQNVRLVHPDARPVRLRRDDPGDADASADIQNHLVSPDLHCLVRAVVAVLEVRNLRLQVDEDAVLHPPAGTADAVPSDEIQDRRAVVLPHGADDEVLRGIQDAIGEVHLRDVDGEVRLLDDDRGDGEGD